MRNPFSRSPRPGTVWTGAACYTTDYSLAPRPGYYALTEDGKQLRQPLLALVCVDDAPGSHTDGACHYEVAAATDPPQKQGPLVALEAHAEGVAELAS